MAQYSTASQVGEALNLEHKEVIRRIRKGDIEARKLGWNWIIETAEVDKVRQKDWYIRLMESRAQRAAS